MNFKTAVFRIIKKIIIGLHKRGLNGFSVRTISLSFYLLLKARNNIKIYGLKNIPRSGPFIFAGAHSSAADAIIGAAVICGLAGKRIRYIAHAKDFRKDNIIRLFHFIFGGYPRKGSGSELVKKMAGWLLKGYVLAITPEGMYNRGKIMKAYTGVTRVYYLANKYSDKPIPIVPAATIGANEAYPPYYAEDGKYKTYRKGIVGIIGRPFLLPPPPGGKPTVDFIRRQTDYIMEKICRLALQKEGPVESWILKNRKRNTPRVYK